MGGRLVMLGGIHGFHQKICQDVRYGLMPLTRTQQAFLQQTVRRLPRGGTSRDWDAMLLGRYSIGLGRLHQYLRTGILLHQVPTEQNWWQSQDQVEYGRMLILEQDFGLKQMQEEIPCGVVSHQVPMEQNWRQQQLEQVE
jgi:hypothetical protein